MIDEGWNKNPPTPGDGFADVVGQDELKRALLSVGSHDDLSGVLVRGEKGTGKSTLARALAGYLPDRRVVADCPFGCPPHDRDRQCPDCRSRASHPVDTRPAPFVTLPLGATREAVVGSLSVADALDGEATFEPGLLASANRGVLYVDEVNLLDDHLVDVVLDAAAAGVNTVERDGVSRRHPAEFTLIGTMNPEEGDLRPQLRDRFDLAVDVSGLRDTADRAAVVDRALGRADDADERDPEFPDPSGTVAGARERLPEVTLPDSFVRDVVELCRDAGVDGHRADIAAARCARVLAALDGRARVIESDVREAASWALPHRLRTDPFEEAADPEDLIDDHLGDDADPDDGRESDTEDGDLDGDTEAGTDDGDVDDRGEDSAGDDAGGDPGPDGEEGGTDDGPEEGDPDPGPEGTDRGSDPIPDATTEAGADDGDSGSSPSDTGDNAGGGDGDVESDDTRSDDGTADDPDEATPLVPGSERAGVGDAVAPELETPEAGERAAGDGTGRGSAAPSTSGTGPRVRTERASTDDPVDAGASVRAAAKRGGRAVEERDLRRSVRAGDAEALVCFVVDASASMRGPMRAAKGVAVDLLRDSYEHRDAVSLVAFAGDDAAVLLPPTDDVGRAARHLKDLPTGDRTPLSAGIDTAAATLSRAEADVSLAVVVTDGGANGAERPTAAVREAGGRLGEVVDRTLVVDAGDAEGVVPTLVETTGAERVPLSALSAGRVDRELGGTAAGESGEL